MKVDAILNDASIRCEGVGLIMSNEPHAHVTVILNKDEPFEKGLRKFKKLCERAGIKKEIKSRRFYEKPSDARRREIRKKERNRRKSERKITSDLKHKKKNKDEKEPKEY